MIDGPDELSTDIRNYLSSCLTELRSEHEKQFADPADPEERVLFEAMDHIQGYALEIITTGEIPNNLAEGLKHFDSEQPLPSKIFALLNYESVLKRIEFDVAAEAINRLTGLPQRVRVATVCFVVLLDATPSLTAVKYLERATRLYLAGFDSEILIMCGAVLEAALATRYPDQLLASSGMTPAFRERGVFSVSQRLKYERKHPVFTPEERSQCWAVFDWRNDAVHVQPDIGPSPEHALSAVAVLLPKILPSE